MGVHTIGSGSDEKGHTCSHPSAGPLPVSLTPPHPRQSIGPPCYLRGWLHCWLSRSAWSSHEGAGTSHGVDPRGRPGPALCRSLRCGTEGQGESSSPGGWAVFRGAGEGEGASSPPISQPPPLTACFSPPSHSKSNQTPLPFPQDHGKRKGTKPQCPALLPGPQIPQVPMPFTVMTNCSFPICKYLGLAMAIHPDYLTCRQW